MRFCHADHLLHSAVTNIDSEQDIDDVPELTPVPTEPEVTDSATAVLQCDTVTGRSEHLADLLKNCKNSHYFILY